MIAYSFDKEGNYIGQVLRQPDPMSPGEFLMPAMATDQPPPELTTENSFIKFDFSKNNWKVVHIVNEQEQNTPPSEEQLIFMRWIEIRERRNDLLKSIIDPQVPYINWGDLSEQEATRYKNYRLALLNVPQDIQSKIDSGEILSVLDVDVNTYSWPELSSVLV